MPRNRSTRRGFISGLAAAPLLSVPTIADTGGGASPPADAPKGAPIYDLNLPPEVLADLEQFAAPIIRDARLLDELHIEDLPAGSLTPAFIFVPR